MAKAKTVYVFTTEEGTREEFGTIGALNKFAGIRATKATIEEGKHPNIEVVEPTPEEEVSEPKGEIMEPTTEFVALIEDAHKAHVANQIPEGFVVGAKVVVNGESTDEDLQSYVVEHNDPVLTIQEVDAEQGIILTEEYLHGIHVADLLLATEPDTFLDDHLEIIAVGDAPTEPLKMSGKKVIVDIEGSDSDMDEQTKADTTYTEDSQEEDTVLTNKDAEDVAELTELGTEPTEEEAIDEDSEEYPEVGEFEDEKDMKKYVKALTDAQLAEWCELEGAEYNPSTHVSINRMRMAMAIKAKHFPNTAPKAGKAKKKSKYGEYSLEDLAEMAINNDVYVRDSKGDPRIERMYLIMALKEAGLIEA